MAEALIIEDNPINQMITAALLRALGIQADIAGTLEEARLMLDESRHAFILSDIVLPDGNGIAFARRYIAGGGTLPIIAMTGALQQVHSQADCLAAGMVAYLLKPFTLQQLNTAIAPYLLPR